MAQPQEDPFTHLLTLEDTLYTSAYTQGSQDGARAGRIEGRVFGLEKGFEKFAELGALHGRACLWGSRIAISAPKDQYGRRGVGGHEGQSNGEAEGMVEEGEAGKMQVEAKREVGEDGVGKSEEHKSLPPLKKNGNGNARLEKHIHLLHGLTDPLTFDTANTEDGVADFDDRFKRAGAKARMIERIIGETNTSSPVREMGGDELETEITASGRQDARSPKRIGSKMKSEAKGQKKGDDNFEDFTGSRLLR